MPHRSPIRTLCILLIACHPAAFAASMPYEGPEHAACGEAFCSASNANDKYAGYVFGKPANTREARDKPEFEWHKHTGRDKDKDYGPSEIPPRGKPEVIHTGSDMDIIPGKPAAVPLPAAAWLLVSGAAGLGLGAWRRGRR